MRCCSMGMGPFWGGAECARAMFSVIATVCASLILLETASGAFLSAVLPHPSRSPPFYVTVH